MEEKNKKQKIIQVLQFIFVFLLSGMIACGGSFLYGKEMETLICNTVMVLLGTGITIFALKASEINGLYFYKHQGHYTNFCIFYMLAMMAAVLFPLLPVAGWPFLVIFVVLSLFSNSISGLVSGSVCLMLAVMLESEGTYHEFFLYFFSGLAGIMVFNRLNANFKVGLPIFISLLCLMVCLTANLVLFEQEKLNLSQLMIAAFNLMLTFILLLIVLKIFSNSVILKYRLRYLELNDPECPLLVQLKEKSKEEYYHAVHTAYLSDKIARNLGLDDMAAKACGYYQRIGQLRGENTWENIGTICEEYKFPPNARKVLQEYTDQNVPITLSETVVVLFSDKIVSSILYFFSQDAEAKLDYEQIVDTVFREEIIESSILERSEITLAQLQKMRKIFIEEKLYYDFLR